MFMDMSYCMYGDEAYQLFKKLNWLETIQFLTEPSLNSQNKKMHNMGEKMTYMKVIDNWLAYFFIALECLWTQYKTLIV